MPDPEALSTFLFTTTLGLGFVTLGVQEAARQARLSERVSQYWLMVERDVRFDRAMRGAK